MNSLKCQLGIHDRVQKRHPWGGWYATAWRCSRCGKHSSWKRTPVDKRRELFPDEYTMHQDIPDIRFASLKRLIDELSR